MATQLAPRTQAEQQAVAEHRATNQRRTSILATVAMRYGMDPEGFARTLRSTVFKGANNEEFAALLVVANEYQLNPLTKQIYAFPQKGGGIVPLVSVDGWIHIMNSHPQFDGIEFTDIQDEKGALYAIEAVIYRKDRTRPIKVTEYLDECKRNTDPWNKSPKRMLRHKALIQCNRVAFGFSGIYDEDDAIIGDITLGGSMDYSPPPTREQAQAIEHQQQEAEPYDPSTGEVLDDRTDEEIARDLDRQTFNAADGNDTGGDWRDDLAQDTIETAGRVFQGNAGEQEEAEPSAAAAVRLVTKLVNQVAKATTLSDIKPLETEFLKHRAALPHDQVKRFEDEVAATRTRLNRGAA